MKTLEIITMLMVTLTCSIIVFKTLNLRSPFRRKFKNRYVTQNDLEESRIDLEGHIHRVEYRFEKEIKRLNKQIKTLKHENT